MLSRIPGDDTDAREDCGRPRRPRIHRPDGDGAFSGWLRCHGVHHTISALRALEAAQWIELLITRVIFPPGQPNGVALARMARVKKPGVKVLFAALPETREHTAGLGEFLPAPVNSADIVTLVGKMLD